MTTGDQPARRRPRVGIVQVWHETNTYSPRPTRLQQFHEFEYATGAELIPMHSGTGTVVGGFLEPASYEAVPIVSARAWPGAPADLAAATTILTDLDDLLSRGGPLDGVLVSLHGAMVAEGHCDMDAEVIRAIRRRVASIPIVVVLDLHGNPSPDLADLCDAALGYDTYPHVDQRERGLEAARLMEYLLAGMELRTRLRKVPLLTAPVAQDTAAEPMRGLLTRARARARAAGLVRISLLPGFPYSDAARTGFSILVISPPGDLAVDAVLEETVADVEANAAGFAVAAVEPQEAVASALAATKGPVVLVDLADNVGGGGAGDGTALLAELVSQRVQGAIVTIADAEVAVECHRAGRGGTLDARVGGKLSELSGAPVEVHGRVVSVTDGEYVTRGSWENGQRFSMGRAALVDANGIQLLVTERAIPPFHSEQLTSLGADPAAAAVLTAKGAVAWKAAFGDIARTIIPVDTPGACPLDPWSLPRAHAPTPV